MHPQTRFFFQRHGNQISVLILTSRYRILQDSGDFATSLPNDASPLSLSLNTHTLALSISRHTLKTFRDSQISFSLQHSQNCQKRLWTTTLSDSLSLFLSLIENSLFHWTICGFCDFLSGFGRQPNKIYSSIGESNTQNSRQFQRIVAQKIAEDRANVCFSSAPLPPPPERNLGAGGGR